MRKQLKQLSPGMPIYTIMIRPTLAYVSITVTKRRILKISIATDRSFEIFTEPIGHKNFSSKINIGIDKENKYIWHAGHFTYCFSEDALLEEIKNELKYIKQRIIEEQEFLIANKYYNRFMPRLRRLIYSNKSGYTELSTTSII